MVKKPNLQRSLRPGNKLNAERFSSISRLLFWVLLAGMLGFFVGGLIGLILLFVFVKARP